jgi:hypothetical protein
MFFDKKKKFKVLTETDLEQIIEKAENRYASVPFTQFKEVTPKDLINQQYKHKKQFRDFMHLILLSLCGFGYIITSLYILYVVIQFSLLVIGKKPELNPFIMTTISSTFFLFVGTILKGIIDKYYCNE